MWRSRYLHRSQYHRGSILRSSRIQRSQRLRRNSHRSCRLQGGQGVPEEGPSIPGRRERSEERSR